VLDASGAPLEWKGEDYERYRDGEAHLLSFAPKHVVAMLRETKEGTSTTKFMVTTAEGGAKHLQGTGVVVGRLTGGAEAIDKVTSEFTMRGVLSKRINVVRGGVL
jgi:hypothetical protein